MAVKLNGLMAYTNPSRGLRLVTINQTIQIFPPHCAIPVRHAVPVARRRVRLVACDLLYVGAVEPEEVDEFAR